MEVVQFPGSPFRLHQPFKPAGDQPKAIAALTQGLERGMRFQTLLGVTGSGKTYTMAQVIARFGKPTLVIAHNKTLAAQLAQEYRTFFPENAVHFFVSYYDYYQPEAYVPATDTYIEKEAQINEEIERMRHAATQALLTRRDVIVVASVSCIYGLGSPEEYERVNLRLRVGASLERASLIRSLVALHFTRTTGDLAPGTFRVVGNRVEVMPRNERTVFRFTLTGTTLASIEELHPLTRERKGMREEVWLFPAKHYITAPERFSAALHAIERELEERLRELKQEGKLLEAERLKRRTQYDLALLRETGYCTGIENYSRHFDGRASGEPPFTLLDYFPKTPEGEPDFLTILDESHVTIPQIAGMYAGDASRKETLIAHGFRLPSAKDNRPLTAEEFWQRVGPVIATSATPGPYERRRSTPPEGQVVEQIVRPTGLVDPELVVRPVSGADSYPGQVEDVLGEIAAVCERGGRVLITTLTKRMAEDLAVHLQRRGIRAHFLHSEVKTIDRVEILTQLRKGEIEVLVGVNLLREGLDLPEVELVAILNADREGFLRSETALIQTIGRAARNVHGKVLLYADTITPSLQRAIDESRRRRAIQLAYNRAHNITPQSVRKAIHDITETIPARQHAAELLATLDQASGKTVRELIRERRKQMEEAVARLDFETAAVLRDEIRALEQKLKEAATSQSRGGDRSSRRKRYNTS